MRRVLMGIPLVLLVLLPGRSDAQTVEGKDAERLVEQMLRVRQTTSAPTSMPSEAGARSPDGRITSTLGGVDPIGDTDPIPDCHADIVGFSASYTTELVEVDLTTMCSSNPFSDANWTVGITFAGWGLDTNADGAEDYVVLLLHDGNQLGAGVFRPTDPPTVVCPATPTWSGISEFGATLDPACLGYPSSFDFYSVMVWDENPFGLDCYCPIDFGPDVGYIGPVAAPTRDVNQAGFTLDGWGGLHPWSRGSATPPPSAIGSPYWSGWNIARGVSIASDGSRGVIVNGWGGAHPFWLGSDGGAHPPLTGPYWPGWDIARDVALLPVNSANPDAVRGFVLDGWGGMHYFSSDGSPAPLVSNAPYWYGWDIARGLALLPDGTGGYVLDGWGGLHSFGIDGNLPPGPVRYGPYWPGWDIARGVSMLSDGSGGYIVDGWGGANGFDLTGIGKPFSPVNGPYWPGWSIVQGIASSSLPPT